jgi:hypothetical protein
VRSRARVIDGDSRRAAFGNTCWNPSLPSDASIMFGGPAFLQAEIMHRREAPAGQWQATPNAEYALIGRRQAPPEMERSGAFRPQSASPAGTTHWVRWPVTPAIRSKSLS